jgi:hypothetical protein
VSQKPEPDSLAPSSVDRETSEACVQGVHFHFHFHSPSPQQSCLLVQQAEWMLARVLRDEPDWRAVLRVEKIEFRTGTAN